MHTETFEHEEITYFLNDVVWTCGQTARSVTLAHMGAQGYQLIFSRLSQSAGTLTDTFER